MLPKPESAVFVIADISGYTGFLARVELEHAQDIIADVMDTMVRRLRPPFRLAKFDGHAAFFYAVADLHPVAACSRGCFLAEARRGLHARNHRCRPRYLQRRYARRCSDSCRCTPNGSYRMRSWRSVLDTA